MIFGENLKFVEFGIKKYLQYGTVQNYNGEEKAELFFMQYYDMAPIKYIKKNNYSKFFLKVYLFDSQRWILFKQKEWW